LRDAWQKSMIVSWISMLPEQLYWPWKSSVPWLGFWAWVARCDYSGQSETSTVSDGQDRQSGNRRGEMVT
jgi:hypothetical protein